MAPRQVERTPLIQPVPKCFGSAWSSLDVWSSGNIIGRYPGVRPPETAVNVAILSPSFIRHLFVTITS